MNMKKSFKRFWTMQKHSGGFTLVELIVVIAILAILAGIGIPAYSGYIEKARGAGDQQLIAAVNTAFNSACALNGIGVSDVNAAFIPVDEDGKMGTAVEETLSAVTVISQPKYITGIALKTGAATEEFIADINAAFAELLAGNENLKFEKIKSSNLVFDPIKGVFVDPESVEELNVAYGDAYVTVKGEAVKAFKDSTWGTVSSSDLLTLVGNVSNLAQAIDNEVFLEMLGKDAYIEASASVLGWSVEDYDANFTAMLEEAGEAWLANNPDGDVEAYMESLGAQMIANNAILVAAKGSQTTGSGIIKLLTAADGKTAKESIKTSMINDPSAGLSQAALAYGLYSSFMLEKYPDTFNPNAPMDFSSVMNTMENPDFQTYLTKGNGQKDLEGYLAALGAVSDNSGSGGIGTDILTSGFSNEELASLMKQVMGK